MSVRFVTANLAYPTPVGKDTDHLDHLLSALYVDACPKPDGLVLGTQETKNFRIRGVLRGIGKALHIPVPFVRQGHGEARSGTSLVGYGVKVHHPRLQFLVDTIATLARWDTRGGVDVPGGRIETHVVHFSPPRSGKTPQKVALEKVKRRIKRAEKRGHGWAVLGDFNMDLFAVARELGGVAHGLRGGIGIITSLNTVVSRDGRDNYGVEHHETDHPAWWVDVERIQREHAHA